MVYPEEYQEQPYQEYERRKSYPEVVIENILKAVVGIFLIAIGFFIVVLVVATINAQTGVEYITYTNDFVITNPAAGAVVYTANPHLSSIVVTKYNATNATYGGVPSTDWTYDDTYGSITIGAGILAWDISQLHVEANTDYSEPPTVSLFTTIAIAIIIMLIMGIFGIVGYRYLNRNY